MYVYMVFHVLYMVFHVAYLKIPFYTNSIHCISMELPPKTKPKEKQRHFTNDEINHVINYLVKGDIPLGLSKSAKYRFVTRYGKGNYKVSLNNQLVFVDGDKHEKTVIPSENAYNVMEQLYKDPATMGTSRDNFFDRIYQTYYGISRRQVQDFLMKQPSYQVHRRVRKGRVVKPIVSKRVNSHWQMDIFAMADPKTVHANNGYSAVLVVIDNFSKYVWAFPLKSQSGEEVATCLKTLFDKHKPSVLQSDNGTHFTANEVSKVCDKFGVKQVFSVAYRPTSQGLVERTNQTLKHKIYQHMTLWNSRKWVDALGDLVINYNTSIHNTTKMKPVDVYEQTYNRQVRKEVSKKIMKAAKTMTKRSPMQAFSDLKPGDYVRVHFDTIESTFKKGYKAQWSNQVYIVLHKTRPDTDTFSYEMYSLKKQNGTKISGTFKRNELLKVVNPTDFAQKPGERPDYSNGKIFDREAHMRKLHEDRRGSGRQQQETPSTPQPRKQPTRTTQTRKKKGDASDLSTRYGLQDFTVTVPHISKASSTDFAKKNNLQNFSVMVPYIDTSAKK